MSLEDEVKARIPTQKLVELTQKDDRSLSVVSETTLTKAADDVRGDFKVFATTTFDVTDPRHVSFGVMGVVIKLKMHSLHPEAPDQHEKWRKMLEEKLGRVTGRDRQRPKSKSPLKIHRDTEVNQDQDVFDLETGLRDIVPGTREGGPDLHNF